MYLLSTYILSHPWPVMLFPKIKRMTEQRKQKNLKKNETNVNLPEPQLYKIIVNSTDNKRNISGLPEELCTVYKKARTLHNIF